MGEHGESSPQRMVWREGNHGSSIGIRKPPGWAIRVVAGSSERSLLRMCAWTGAQISLVWAGGPPSQGGFTDALAEDTDRALLAASKASRSNSIVPEEWYLPSSGATGARIRYSIPSHPPKLVQQAWIRAAGAPMVLTASYSPEDEASIAEIFQPNSVALCQSTPPPPPPSMSPVDPYEFRRLPTESDANSWGELWAPGPSACLHVHLGHCRLLADESHAFQPQQWQLARFLLPAHSLVAAWMAEAETVAPTYTCLVDETARVAGTRGRRMILQTPHGQYVLRYSFVREGVVQSLSVIAASRELLDEFHANPSIRLMQSSSGSPFPANIPIPSLWKDFLS